VTRIQPPADISPHDFFTRWISDAVAGDPDRRAKLGGTHATIVFHMRGAGEDEHEDAVFTVAIDGGVVTGSPGDQASADLRVRLDVTTWRRLNSGEIAAPQALLKRKVKLEGDFLLGLKLHLILG
jgi:putative sterol carrier protein